MSTKKAAPWKPGRKDAIFLTIVLVVIILLVLGSHDRTTKATPNDAMHQQALNHQTCLQCHDANGTRPQPIGHSSSTQCFQCHAQPKGWQGMGK
ncbi:MAG: hypothetical protein R8K53_05285 [Mariprofundaceae bacterium]